MSMFNECHIHLCDCTWLNVFYILNFCWSNTKRFLSVLIVFGKSFVFAKISKISKTVLPSSGDLVAGQASHMPQSWAYIEGFCNSLADQCPSHEIDLEFWKKFWVFESSYDLVWWLDHEWKLQSRGYTEIFTAPFVTLSWVDLRVAKNTKTNFSKFCL